MEQVQRGIGKVVTGPNKVIYYITTSGNQCESGRSPGSNGIVKTISNNIVNPSRQVVSMMQLQGNEQMSSKGTACHTTSVRNYNMVVQQGKLVLNDGVGTDLQLSDHRCDDPDILAGKTFSVTSGILAKGIFINQ